MYGTSSTLYFLIEFNVKTVSFASVMEEMVMTHQIIVKTQQRNKIPKVSKRIVEELVTKRMPVQSL